VVLDDQRLAGQRLDLGVAETEPPAIGVRHVHGGGRAAGGHGVRVDHLDQLAAAVARDHRRPTGAQRRLVHVELVRVHGALYDRLAKTIRRGHEHRVAKARFGVEREHHAARANVAAHHALDASRQQYVFVGEALVDAVGDGTVVVKRGEHVTHRLQHVLGAADIEEGFLLTGERRVRQVFGGG
jgi:hypothetical protein